MLQVAMANCRGSNHERAIRHGFNNRLVHFCSLESGSSSYSGTGILECNIIGVNQSQVRKSKIAHGPSGRADVEGIARVHQNDAQTIEFTGRRQAVRILRQEQLIASLLPQSLFTSP